MIFLAKRITRDLLMVVAGWLISVSAWSWMPNETEWTIFCKERPEGWDKKFQSLLEYPDEAILNWLQTPLGKYGTTPVHICAMYGRLDLLDRLLQRVSENYQALLTEGIKGHPFFSGSVVTTAGW